MAQAKQMMLSVESMDAYMSLFGLNDQNMALIEQECNVTVALRGNELIISGEAEDVELASSVLEKLLDMLRRHEQMDRARIRYAIALARDGKVDMIDDILKSVVAITHRGKQIRCKSSFDYCHNHLHVLHVECAHCVMSFLGFFQHFICCN